MLRRKPQAETPGIELGEARAEGEEQVAFEQNLLHGAEARDAAEGKRMIGGDHAFAAGGGKHWRLQQFGKLQNLRAGVANTAAKQQYTFSAGSHLLCYLSDFFSRRATDSAELFHFAARTSNRRMKKIMRHFDENRAWRSEERRAG